MRIALRVERFVIPVYLLVLALLLAIQRPNPAFCAGDTDSSCPPERIENPRLVHRVSPRYPAEARREHVWGEVTLEAQVLKDGSVSEVKVVKCTSPRHGFEAAAIEAVKQWRYEPGTCDGKPVDVWFQVVVSFR